jgi:nitrogen regulatory protein P-II 1
MKKVEAIIQPHLLQRVMQALHGLPHFPGVTVHDCHGQARGQGAGGHYEPTTDSVFFKKMTKLELFCSDACADELVAAIRAAAHTGNPGDGVIGVSDLSRVIRIRTGQERDEAV